MNAASPVGVTFLWICQLTTAEKSGGLLQVCSFEVWPNRTHETLKGLLLLGLYIA